ncbi:MAG TPA: hypothetical protein VM759_07150 [Longimicrobium sp.]|nr:hypothetical protein [Longimicrobium sp.]
MEKGARAYGLNPIIVDSPMTPNLEGYIRERIRACSVMLQVVNLSRDELRLLDPEKREGRPRLHWFSFEYGVAIERDMPVVRLVDASVMGIPEWKEELATGAGGVLIPFDSRDPDSMEEEIDRAMQALAAHVHHEPVES